MIIVTGGAGFIGSNIVRGLNARGRTDIVVVDDMTEGKKAFNLADCIIADYVDHEEFATLLKSGDKLPWDVSAVSHQGACTVTTEWDGEFMMRVNFEFSKLLLNYCLRENIPLVYASSASVYGLGRDATIAPDFERPVNIYAWSKLVFDQYVRNVLPSASSQIVGLRYFNVFGPGETHKGGMASVMFHFNNQLREGDSVRLFKGCDGFADGEQRRDFIHVDDVVKTNLWFMENNGPSGIYNLGTGKARSFNAAARGVIDWHQRGAIEYIPFPDKLKGSYQSFTEADITSLRAAGYAEPFMSLEDGVRSYLDHLNAP